MRSQIPLNILCRKQYVSHWCSFMVYRIKSGFPPYVCVIVVFRFEFLGLVYWCICALPAFSALHIQVPINSIRPSDAYMHYCVTKLAIIVPDNGFVAWPAPSYYVKKCWNIVKSNIRNKFQWNLQRNSNICTQNNAFQMSPGKWRRKIHAREEKLTKMYRLYQRRRWCVYNFNCILKYFWSSRSIVYVSFHLSSHCHRR